MDNTWEILCKELAYQGFKLVGNGQCQFWDPGGGIRTASIPEVRRMLGSYINENLRVFSSVWSDVANLLLEVSHESSISDERSIDLFTDSLKSLAMFLDLFDGPNDVKQVIERSLGRDINSFSRHQIKELPNLRIVVDWIHRGVSKQSYVCRLLSFAEQGPDRVRSIQVKFARGISGPWSNLDLPWRERVWEWAEEDENFRGRDYDIRNLRRYRKGLRNYNNDGRVGEGHYWRELRNEPFRWSNRYEEDPYPHRNVITRP